MSKEMYENAIGDEEFERERAHRARQSPHSPFEQVSGCEDAITGGDECMSAGETFGGDVHLVSTGERRFEGTSIREMHDLHERVRKLEGYVAVIQQILVDRLGLTPEPKPAIIMPDTKLKRPLN